MAKYEIVQETCFATVLQGPSALPVLKLFSLAEDNHHISSSFPGSKRRNNNALRIHKESLLSPQDS